MSTEYLVEEKPLQELSTEIFGEPYVVKEYPLVAIAWPYEGNVAFIIDKKEVPWKTALPAFLPTPFSRYSRPGITVARMGKSGGLIFSEAGDPKQKLIVHQGKLRLIVDLDDPEIISLDWECLPPDPNFMPPTGAAIGDGFEEDETLRQERLTYLAMLQPNRWWVGRAIRALNREYLVAEYDSVDMVVADCPRLGNALFGINRTECITKEGRDWKGILSLTKPEIRKLEIVTRICHQGKWHRRLIELLQPPGQ